MRYFAHDGSTTHGPATVDELTARPWFDGDVLVCPVGSQDSGDWKPALAYPAFKAALLAPPKPAEPPAPAPLPIPAPAPMPVFVPPPAPVPAPAPQEPCPFCRTSNPLNSRFCNSCGKHMDGSVTPPPRAIEPPPPAAFEPPFPVDPPSVFEPPRALEPERAPEPLRPMERPPERSGPMSRPLSPLGAAEPEPTFSPEAEHTFASLSTQMPHPIEPEPSLAPAAAPPEAAAPARKRPAAVLAFVAAAAVSGAAAWMFLRPAPVSDAPPTSASGGDLNLSAPSHTPEMGGAPSAQTMTAALEPAPAPVKTGAPAPSVKKPYPKLKPATEFSPLPQRKPRTARRAKPVPLPREPDAADAILIESRAADSEPTVPGAGSGDQPLTDPDAAPADFLPGIPRRPGLKSPKAKPAKPAKTLKTVKAAEDADAQALDSVLGEFNEPGASGAAPTPAAAEPAAPISIGQKATKAASAAANPADALAIQQAVEEFEFCSQLLTQGAYADHFDTCLCKETREKAPYRNRRGFYVSSLEKEAAAGRLEVKAEIISTRMENGVARIVAKWKARGNDPGREVDEAWIMDDGLWCKAP